MHDLDVDVVAVVLAVVAVAQLALEGVGGLQGVPCVGYLAMRMNRWVCTDWIETAD